MPVGSPRSATSLDDVLRACEDCYRNFGFINYAQVGRALGVSRQAIQARLKTAHERGQITDATYERYRPVVVNTNVTMEIQVSPETREFLRQLSDKLDLRMSTIVEAAITKYRHSLQLPEGGLAG